MTDETTITPENDGPYHVRGAFQVVLPSVEITERPSSDQANDLASPWERPELRRRGV